MVEALAPIKRYKADVPGPVKCYAAGERVPVDGIIPAERAELEVPPGSRGVGPGTVVQGAPLRGGGPALIKALDQVAEIMALGLARVGTETLVPPRRRPPVKHVPGPATDIRTASGG